MQSEIAWYLGYFQDIFIMSAKLAIFKDIRINQFFFSGYFFKICDIFINWLWQHQLLNCTNCVRSCDVTSCVKVYNSPLLQASRKPVLPEISHKNKQKIIRFLFLSLWMAIRITKYTKFSTAIKICHFDCLKMHNRFERCVIIKGVCQFV